MKRVRRVSSDSTLLPGKGPLAQEIPRRGLSRGQIGRAERRPRGGGARLLGLQEPRPQRHRLPACARGGCPPEQDRQAAGLARELNIELPIALS